jgi:hypothetical protein
VIARVDIDSLIEAKMQVSRQRMKGNRGIVEEKSEYGMCLT